MEVALMRKTFVALLTLVFAALAAPDRKYLEPFKDALGERGLERPTTHQNHKHP